MTKRITLPYCHAVSCCAMLCCVHPQTAEATRLRCLEAQELIHHLQTFSCHSAGGDFSKLPPIFTNDATLGEAAVSEEGDRCSCTCLLCMQL